MSHGAGGERLEGCAAGVDTEGDTLGAQLLGYELVQPLLHLQHNNTHFNNREEN